jgi:NADH-quinone oxidoreductase subunit N
MPDVIAFIPELIITVAVCLLLLIDLVVPKSKKHYLGILALIGLFLTVVSVLSLWGQYRSTFSDMFVLDGFALYFKLVFLLVTILTILISFRYLIVEGINLGEYYAMLLFATLGMMLMAAGTDLIAIYIALELMALSLYILAGFIKRDPKSLEAALKYFLLGAFTSGIVLYGMALLYGLTGTTNLKAIADYLTQPEIRDSPALILAMILLVAGFSFKIAAVPFHMWVPDVYEGAPTTVTAFMSVGPKAAGFAALMRIFIVAIVAIQDHWVIIFWVLAVLSMTIGNVVAIAQTSIKRMLAYSSIAHAGYILIGLVAGSQLGYASMLLYFVVYVFMNLGAFAMIVLLCSKTSRGDQISDFAGLSQINPYAALAFLIFFLSLAGIPPTAGFVAKLYIFAAAIKANCIWLAIIGVLNSAVSVYYYFRVTRVMYMEEVSGSITLSVSPSLVAALAIMAVATILIGIYPGPFIRVAIASMAPFLP